MSQRTNRFNSYIIVNKIKKRTLLFLVVSFWIVFTIFSTEQITNGKDWIQIGVTLSMFASLLIFYPMIEKWIYKPWQNNPTKQEYTFLK